MNSQKVNCSNSCYEGQFYTQCYNKSNFYKTIIPPFTIETWRILVFYTRMNIHKFGKISNSRLFTRLLESQRPRRAGIYALFGGFCLFYSLSKRLIERYRDFYIKTSAYKR